MKEKILIDGSGGSIPMAKEESYLLIVVLLQRGLKVLILT